MDAVVQQTLGNVHGGHAFFLLEVCKGHNKFVHTAGIKSDVIDILEMVHHVVAVEDCVGGSLRHTLFAQGHQVGQSANDH